MNFEAMNSADTPSYETVQFTAQDILGAHLDELLDKHTIPKLHHWLLCRGTKPPLLGRRVVL